MRNWELRFSFGKRAITTMTCVARRAEIRCIQFYQYDEIKDSTIMEKLSDQKIISAQKNEKILMGRIRPLEKKTLMQVLVRRENGQSQRSTAMLQQMDYRRNESKASNPTSTMGQHL